MSNGEKPRYTLQAKVRLPKGAPKPARGETEYIKLASGWDGQYGVNVQLSKGGGQYVGVAKIVLTDGREITPDSHWIEWKDWSGGRRSRSSDEPQSAGDSYEGGDDDQIPF